MNLRDLEALLAFKPLLPLHQLMLGVYTHTKIQVCSPTGPYSHLVAAILLSTSLLHRLATFNQQRLRPKELDLQ